MISKLEFQRWRKLIPIVPFAILFVVLALWREAEKINLRVIGRTIIVGFLAVNSLSIYFTKLTTGKFFGPAPLIELGLISNRSQTLSQFAAGLGTYLNGTKTALWLDSFAFVPLYLGFLLILSSLLNRRRQKWANAASIIAVLCASAGAIADLFENYYSLLGLNSSSENSTQIAESITLAAQFKWTLIFVAIGLISLIFWRSNWRNLWNMATVLLLLGVILGIIGTFTYPFTLFCMPMVTFALVMEFLILATTGILFQAKFLRQHFLYGF